MERDQNFVGVKMPSKLHKKMMEHINENTHFSKSEYIRDLIRRDLDEK